MATGRVDSNLKDGANTPPPSEMKYVSTSTSIQHLYKYIKSFRSVYLLMFSSFASLVQVPTWSFALAPNA
jgi:hypothetical protein